MLFGKGGWRQTWKWLSRVERHELLDLKLFPQLVSGFQGLIIQYGMVLMLDISILDGRTWLRTQNGPARCCSRENLFPEMWSIAGPGKVSWPDVMEHQNFDLLWPWRLPGIGIGSAELIRTSKTWFSVKELGSSVPFLAAFNWQQIWVWSFNPSIPSVVTQLPSQITRSCPHGFCKTV